MLYKFIIILLIITSQYQSILTTNCIINSKGWCEFRNVRATEGQPLFQPNSGSSEKITRILFTDSAIPVFTTETCIAFPELRRLDVEQVSLAKLNAEALDNCIRLLYVSFFNNNLQTINRDTFKRNTVLKFISLTWNKLTHIDMTTFSHLYFLEELALDNNQITVIDFRAVGELSKMSILHLGSNQLIDFDEKVIVKRFPNLKKVYFEDNLFPCTRVRDMLTELKKVNISVGEGASYRQVDVHYERKLVQNIDCLDTKAYNEMLGTRFGSAVNEGKMVSVKGKDDKPEESNPKCWYIGGGVGIVLILVILWIGGWYWTKKRSHGMENGDYYYDYQTQEKLARESRL